MEHKCLSPWKGAVAGGLIAFVWSSISWMALPFHEKTLSEFKDPVATVQMLSANAPSSGAYIVKYDMSGKTMPTGPFVFLSLNREGWGSMGATMALGLAMQMAGGFFWTWILGKIPGLTSKDAALYGCFFGLCVGILGAMPNSVWWKFPWCFSLLYVADAVVSWTVASVVIARFCQASACALPTKAA
ncbi:MAG: hypothetical protein HY078_09170 [Elusimicrobia bacterium]|nr:hypothetical protein [Elusimicrobiota bacterium]